MTVSDVIFNLLCGLIYLAGIPFGWDYREASVYFCLWCAPLAVLASSLLVLAGSVRGLIRQFGVGRLVLVVLFSILSLAAVGMVEAVFRHYKLIGGDAVTIFNQCVADLTEIARQLNCTYEQVNLYVFVLAPVCVMAINVALFCVMKKRM